MYFVIDTDKNDEYINDFTDEGTACKYAKYMWDFMSDHDKKRRTSFMVIKARCIEDYYDGKAFDIINKFL